MSKHPATQLALVLLVAGCSSERDLPEGQGGVHPAGWSDEASAEFHAVFLQDNAYPLDDCQTCHGADYAGGDVDVGCGGDGCHSGSVERCGTCHGDFEDDPRPATNAHPVHADYCDTCHPVPAAYATPGHVDGTVDLEFGGLATAAGATPSWDGDGCSGVYCHVDGTPVWAEPGPLGCGDCHAAPPGTHARFARVATVETCGDCHADPSGATHVDGAVDLGDPGCAACHGTGTGAPPPGLDGETDPTAPSVGAHRRHTDSLVPGRIGRVVACTSCHPVPQGVLDTGHLDDAPPADVSLALFGDYDAGAQSCVVWCHWDNDPGPIWTDASGDARACDACHGYPPVQTRIGTPHPPALPSQCADCHPVSPAIHVDGKVDFL